MLIFHIFDLEKKNEAFRSQIRVVYFRVMVVSIIRLTRYYPSDSINKLRNEQYRWDGRRSTRESSAGSYSASFICRLACFGALRKGGVRWDFEIEDVIQYLWLTRRSRQERFMFVTSIIA